METCKCGRAYYPKQRWIHEPLCRYVDEVEPNHVKPENRFAVETETAETETRVDVETGEIAPWVSGGVSRATWFRRKKAGGSSEVTPVEKGTLG
jgi:hypothetical protein